MIALLGGIYNEKYVDVVLPPGAILHVTAGKKSETYRVLQSGGLAEVVDEAAGKIDLAIKPQYVCPQHTFPAGLGDGSRTPPGAIR